MLSSRPICSRGVRLSVETEPQLEHSTLTLGQLLERILHELAAQCVTGLLGRIHGALVGEQIAELAVAVGADRLVQRDGCLDRAESLLDVAPGRAPSPSASSSTVGSSPVTSLIAATARGPA